MFARPRAGEFSRRYSDAGFWRKLSRFAKTAGAEVVERALQLYYAAQHPHTPAWAKTVIYGALGYFITPLDAIPDLVPAAGYTDDLGALMMALITVMMYITPEVKAKAKTTMTAWFGEQRSRA
jgi:uncharacterized membrane protein YkvA (DUF1232 family)